MIAWVKKFKAWVCSRWKNTLTALKVEVTFDVDFRIHITNKTA